MREIVGVCLALALIGCESKDPSPPAPPAPSASAKASTAQSAASAPPALEQPKEAVPAKEARPVALRYEVERTDDPEFGESRLLATRAGEKVEAIPKGKWPCLSVVTERDLDGDGIEDALMASTCGGNLMPASYLFVAGRAKGPLKVHSLGEQWDEPQVEMFQGKPSLVITSDNEGYNLERPRRVTKRFVFQKGAPVVIEETEALELKALANLRAEQFEGRAPDEPIVLSYDLDADGSPDEIRATLWERWGRLKWQVRFADGTESGDGGHNCKRLGVLAQRTAGRHDLVCDFDTRLRWDGKAYGD